MPLRGGNWNNGTQAGVFALNLNNRRSLSNVSVGFRAALPLQSDTYALRGICQYQGDKGARFRAAGQKIQSVHKPPVARRVKAAYCIKVWEQAIVAFARRQFR